MQKRLAKLGFAMPLEPVPNFKEIDPHAFDSDEAFPGDRLGGSGASLRKTASSHTAGRSAHTSGRAETAPSSPFIQRPMKRQRLDSPLPGNMQIDHPPSREAMPPPPKPMSRMQSVRKMFPSLRKKFSNGRPTPVMKDVTESNGDVQMYDNGHWQNTHNSRVRSETPYMSGALPVEQSAQVADPRGSQLLTSVGIHDNRSDFTFRASSPVKMHKQEDDHRPVQLPTEPSYIRLMDGLSRDNGVELGLKDPRGSTTKDYRDDSGNRQVTRGYQDQYEPQERESQKRWGLGHPFMHQSPFGSSDSVDVRGNPPTYHKTDGYTNRVYNQPAFGPTTPAPRRNQNPGHQIESVVSPFFRNSQIQAPAHSRQSLAEPQVSSSRFAAYQSPRSKTSDRQPAWREPRSLNGLSFFDSPVNSRNEPINLRQGQRLVHLEPKPPSRHYQSRHLDSRGFITRPEPDRSPYVGGSAYGFSQDRLSYSRQAPRYSQAAISLPSFNRSSISRIGQVPSSMPSIISSGRSPARTQPQWENLQRAGVRSSRNTFGSSIAGNIFSAPSNKVFASTGRRSARR
jgi:hypothetical protein